VWKSFTKSHPLIVLSKRKPVSWMQSLTCSETCRSNTSQKHLELLMTQPGIHFNSHCVVHVHSSCLFSCSWCTHRYNLSSGKHTSLLTNPHPFSSYTSCENRREQRHSSAEEMWSLSQVLTELYVGITQGWKTMLLTRLKDSKLCLSFCRLHSHRATFCLKYLTWCWKGRKMTAEKCSMLG